jgi:hypothetical protein
MNFIYLNSNKSGIGDRIHDIMLAYTYSQYMKCEKIYLHWIHSKNENDDIYLFNTNDIYGVTRKNKTPFRDKDYLLHNLLNYIIFPDNMIFVSEEELNNLKNNPNNFLFSDYLGLQFSIYIFTNIFLQNENEINKIIFIENYFENFKKIKFKNIPENIINIFKENEIVTIHLRRGDKVINDNGVTNNITYNEIDNLNNITEEFINKCILLNYKNICFISDEKEVKNLYIEKFKDKCNIINIDGNEISQTYYDIFCMVNSKKILLSQMFSAFSLTSCLIGDTKLYYIYNKGKIIDMELNNYKNIIYYNDLN